MIAAQRPTHRSNLAAHQAQLKCPPTQATTDENPLAPSHAYNAPMVLKRFERALERIFEDGIARPFRSGLQPIEIGKRITREMDDKRTVGTERLIAPNHFLVTVSSEDRAQFAPYEEALSRELATTARQHAREEGYGLVSRVEVRFRTSPKMKPGGLNVQGVIDQDISGPTAELLLEDGARLPIGIDTVEIGRTPESAVTLSDPRVSRLHARIVRRNDVHVLEDLGSTNGTTVNGTLVRSHVLADHDRITIGSTTMIYESL